MPLINLEKSSSGWLAPYDAQSAEYVRAWPVGKTLQVNAKFVRSGPFHRRQMALVNLLWQSSVIDAPTFDAALDIAKLVAGWTEPRILPDGSVHIVPRSISYANADEQAYTDGFARPLERWALAQLPHLDDEALKREIEGFA